MDDTSAPTSSSASQMERKMSAMACEVFNELRLEGKLCDVIINVNGFEFNAHKNILCSCSHYFRSVLEMSLQREWGQPVFPRLCPMLLPYLWCLRWH